ncbi:MAG: hypothetical protein AAGI01_08205 [Myxococcota bacterium]
MKRASYLFLAIATLLMFIGCGWFNEDDLDISYTEEIPINIPRIDSAMVCPDGVDCAAASIPSPMDRDLNPVALDVEIDIVEATGQPELSQYTGRFKEISISRIEYEFTENTLTFDLPETTIYLGPLGSTSPEDDGVVPLAVLPETPAMQAASGTAQITEANRQATSDLIKTLQTSAIIAAQPRVKMGQPFPPRGAAEVKATIFVTFVANPADAINR